MTNPFERVLFLSPHQDDEALASGGVLHKCQVLTILYFNDHHPLVDDYTYHSEAKAVSDQLKCNVFYSAACDVNKLDQHPLAYYISEIESFINYFKPTLVLIPARSRNQDHQVVYDAAMVAVRAHDKNWYVPFVWLYEQHEYMTPEFVPDVFVEIDIENKLKLFSHYQSQQRGYRKPEHIKALAVLRGSQSNFNYAEAYMSIRNTYR